MFGAPIVYGCQPEVEATSQSEIRPALPADPTELTASGVSTSSIELKWKDNSDNERSFRIERKQTGTSVWDEVGKVSGGASSYTDGGLASGQSYDYRVWAKDRRFRSGYSNEATARTKDVDTCSYQLEDQSDPVQPFAAAGGTGKIAVTTQVGCGWSVAESLDWVTISAGSSGSGSGSLTFSVAANPSGTSRSGTMTIGGQEFKVSQAGVECTYSISPSNATLLADGGTGNISITAPPGCSWMVTEALDWVTVTGGASGSGNGTVTYSVGVNTVATPRNGTIQVADQSFSLTQRGTTCTYAVAPTTITLPSGGGTGDIGVSAPAGCNWAVTESLDWVTITSSAAGSGNGTVTYTVSASAEPSARSGTMMIADQVVTLSQASAPPPCTYVLTPASDQFEADGGLGSFQITASASTCVWEARSSDSWISIASDSVKGQGSGLIAYAVASYAGSVARQGSILVADQTFNVSQAKQCISNAQFFAQDVWGKVLSPLCKNCHIAGGVAGGTMFLLSDDMNANLAAARNVAVGQYSVVDGYDEPKILLKPTQTIPHGGGAPVPRDSENFMILSEFVERMAQTSDPCSTEDPTDFFAGIEFSDPREFVRDATLMLANRLPSEQELSTVATGEDANLEILLDELMTEEPFYQNFIRFLNDIFLFDAYLDGFFNTSILSMMSGYPNRDWYSSYEPATGDATLDSRLKAWARSSTYFGVTRGPVELAAYLVRNDRPFTELVTADFKMVNPYSAKAYGVESLVTFTTSEDPNLIGDRDEFVPVKMPEASYIPPAAGILSDHVFHARYPTSSTNRNRHRSSTIMNYFLGFDILDMAQPIDPTQVADVENPTLNAPQCNSCHNIMDPLAGTLKNFDQAGRYRQRSWYSTMLDPGYFELSMPVDESSGVQWLGRQIAQDERFAKTWVKHMWHFVMGRKVLPTPDSAISEFYDAHLLAYNEQQAFIDDLTDTFVASNYNIKTVIKAIMLSPFFQASNVDPTTLDARRAAELHDIGRLKLLSPEELAEKIEAIFGHFWTAHISSTRGEDALRHPSYYYSLYGGVNSDDGGERAEEPSAMLASVMQLMANNLACKATGTDFGRPVDERMLFPFVTTDDLPATSADKIRENIGYLFERILGRFDPSAEEIERTYQMFADIQADGIQRVQSSVDDEGPANVSDANIAPGCYGVDRYQNSRVYPTVELSYPETRSDPNYTVRAWTAVIALMLHDHDFVYR